MTFIQAYSTAASVAFSMMAALWLCSLPLKDVSIVDRFWGLGFVLITWALSTLTIVWDPGKFLTLVCVSIWGIRLSLYIHWRNKGHPEDYRYASMRQEHNKTFWWYSFFSIFILQGVIMLLVSMPIIWLFSEGSSQPNVFILVPGVCCWIFGFILEAGGDLQLSRFKKNPENRGKLLNTGFWSLTRHPNYFGDALQWWGIGLLACAYGPSGAFTLLGPLLMTLFIRKVSGVDLLEKSLKNQKPGYAEYIQKVPAFLPIKKFWFTLGGVILIAELIVAVC